MDKVELSGIEWYFKLHEGLTMALRDISDGRMPQEHHLAMMKAIFPVYERGELVLHKTASTGKEEMSSQGSLFSAEVSANTQRHTS